MQLGTEMGVDPDEPKILRRRDRATLRERIAAGDRCAELAIEHAGAQMRMRVSADAGRHTEPDVLRMCPPRDQAPQPVDLVGAVDDDPTDAEAQRGPQLLVGLRVPV